MPTSMGMLRVSTQCKKQCRHEGRHLMLTASEAIPSLGGPEGMSTCKGTPPSQISPCMRMQIFSSHAPQEAFQADAPILAQEHC